MRSVDREESGSETEKVYRGKMGVAYKPIIISGYCLMAFLTGIMSSHLYLNIAYNYTDCVKATFQDENRKTASIM